MKRIKSVNGYAIYQATTQRDADNYGLAIGEYNIYLASDIRDFGLSCSDPEYDRIETLANALEICNGSNFAVACALAEELSDSTIQDMDLCLEIERRLDAGQTVESVRESYDTEEQRFEETDFDDTDAVHVGRFLVRSWYAGLSCYAVLDENRKEIYNGCSLDEVIRIVGCNPYA